MKAIYNITTFLAAVVVLTWASWETYLHWNVIKTTVQHQVNDCCKEKHVPAKD